MKMPWQPAPEALVRLFQDSAAGLPRATVKKMFGYPAAFVNGNMFAGVFRDQVFLRLSPEDRARLDGAQPFEPMPGRTMREYVVAPSGLLGSRDGLVEWLGNALRHTRTLPPKAAKKKAPRAG